jgi:hypothetical protein
MTRNNRIVFGLLFLWFAAVAPAAEDPVLRCRWSSPNDRAALDFSFRGNPLLVMLPGENLEVSTSSDGLPGRVTILREGQPFREDATLNFTAPEKPGAYYIPLSLAAGDRRRDADMCVVIPFRGSARKTDKGSEVIVEGRSMGEYRHPGRSGNRKVRENPDSYQPPVHWLRITDANAGFEVAPGLTVGELVAPSEDTGTRHTDLVPVCYPMWKAIHTLRAALAERLDIPGPCVKLISMFRSPAYNRSIGSNAFGRHVYGDAFDFYIDLKGDPDNLKASDLNRDGRLDRRDAYPVVAVIEDLQADGRLPMGGVGIYNTVGGDHVVTMHLDMRGHRATWGYLYGASGKRSDFSWASKRFADLDRRDEDIAAGIAAKEGKKYVRPHREPLP